VISTRLAPATLCLLLLALIPTALHTYRGVSYDDGVRPKQVPVVIDGVSSMAESRRDTWGQRRFNTDDWIDRWYGTVPRLRLTVVRTYDAKAVYHHPELAISYPEAMLGPARLERLSGGEPVFVLRGMDQSRDLVAYALLSDGRVVDDPYVEQARMALRMLVGGRRPMTLVYVQDRNPPPVPLERQPAMAMLARALALVRAPGPAGAGTTQRS
jgi:hypothetical protein